jgi:hypothetical protein
MDALRLFFLQRQAAARLREDPRTADPDHGRTFVYDGPTLTWEDMARAIKGSLQSLPAWRLAARRGATTRCPQRVKSWRNVRQP